MPNYTVHWHNVKLLSVAISKGNLRIVEVLLEAGAKVHEKDYMGWTALRSAVLYGRLDIINLLYEVGARDSEIISWARTSHNSDVMKYLVNGGMVHHILRNICMALVPLDLPPYVLLEIFNWLPDVDRMTDLKKIRVIQGIRNSREEVLNKRRIGL